MLGTPSYPKSLSSSWPNAPAATAARPLWTTAQNAMPLAAPCYYSGPAAYPAVRRPSTACAIPGPLAQAPSQVPTGQRPQSPGRAPDETAVRVTVLPPPGEVVRRASRALSPTSVRSFAPPVRHTSPTPGPPPPLIAPRVSVATPGNPSYSPPTPSPASSPPIAAPMPVGWQHPEMPMRMPSASPTHSYRPLVTPVTPLTQTRRLSSALTVVPPTRRASVASVGGGTKSHGSLLTAEDRPTRYGCLTARPGVERRISTVTRRGSLASNEPEGSEGPSVVVVAHRGSSSAEPSEDSSDAGALANVAMAAVRMALQRQLADDGGDGGGSSGEVICNEPGLSAGILTEAAAALTRIAESLRHAEADATTQLCEPQILDDMAALRTHRTLSPVTETSSPLKEDSPVQSPPTAARSEEPQLGISPRFSTSSFDMDSATPCSGVHSAIVRRDWCLDGSGRHIEGEVSPCRSVFLKKIFVGSGSRSRSSSPKKQTVSRSPSASNMSSRSAENSAAQAKSNARPWELMRTRTPDDSDDMWREYELLCARNAVIDSPSRSARSALKQPSTPVVPQSCADFETPHVTQRSRSASPQSKRAVSEASELSPLVSPKSPTVKRSHVAPHSVDVPVADAESSNRKRAGQCSPLRKSETPRRASSLDLPPAVSPIAGFPVRSNSPESKQSMGSTPTSGGGDGRGNGQEWLKTFRNGARREPVGQRRSEKLSYKDLQQQRQRLVQQFREQVASGPKASGEQHPLTSSYKAGRTVSSVSDISTAVSDESDLVARRQSQRNQVRAHSPRQRGRLAALRRQMSPAKESSAAAIDPREPLASPKSSARPTFK